MEIWELPSLFSDLLSRSREILGMGSFFLVVYILLYHDLYLMALVSISAS